MAKKEIVVNVPANEQVFEWKVNKEEVTFDRKSFDFFHYFKVKSNTGIVFEKKNVKYKPLTDTPKREMVNNKPILIFENIILEITIPCKATFKKITI